MRVATIIGNFLAITTGSYEQIDTGLPILLANEVETTETGFIFYLNSSDQKLKDTGAAFRESGIALRSVHAPFGERENLSALDKGQRKEALDVHKRLLRNVSLAGVEMIVVHPGSSVEKDEDIPTMHSLIRESLSELVPVAQSEGVKIALENMLPKHPGADGREILGVVEDIGSEWLGVCFDTGHAHVNGDMRGTMEILKDKIITFHIHDNDGMKDMHLQPPYGTINWADFVDCLDTMDFGDPITIESAPWGSERDLKWMQKEVRTLLNGARNGEYSGTAVHCTACGHRIFKGEEGWFCRCSQG